MTRSAVVLCPGRGSYMASELGYLGRSSSASRHAELDVAIARADERREKRGDRTIRSLDEASAFDADFFRGENAAALTFACTASDYLRLDEDKVDVVAIGGNSMGWYSALYAAGVLGLDDAFDLVETMGGMTRDGSFGGQVLYPLVDDDWCRAPELAARVETALQTAREEGHAAGWSIRYGGYAVLWADDGGAEALLNALPEVEAGKRRYPLRLPGHAAFHSPLMAEASARGSELLEALPWRSPRVPLIDGRGVQWRDPGSDPVALSRYTLQAQVVTTFDFTATVRVALREYAPDLVVLLGPGDGMGAAVAQILIEERWRGLKSRSDFIDRQREDPFVISMARVEQAERVSQAPD